MIGALLVRPFGIDLFCLGKKFLVYNLVSRNLKVKYRRSILGVFWTLMAPVAMGAVYYFVFQKILKVEIPHYLAFILCGVLPWAFFSQTLAEGMECLVISIHLISKVPVPLQVFPFVGALTNLVTLALAIPVLLLASWFSGVSLGLSILLVPLLFGCLFLMAYGFSIILAISFVYLRDLRHILSIFLQLWFYGTPVLYSETMIPENYAWIVDANPVGNLFVSLHAVFVHGAWPDERAIAMTAVWSLLLVLAGAAVQRYFSRELVENL